jgi:dTDP-4-dehydrorhamnose 3,5-epimerase
MAIKVTPTAIPDVLIIEPRVFSDDRGWFFESFNEREFLTQIHQNTSFVQDNHSLSKRGVLRGLHYQTKHTQGKLVRVIKGAVFDVAIDLRKSSAHYGQWIGVELSAANQKQLWIPPGFAHGFLVLSEEAEFFYKTTDYWDATSECCIRWSDETLKIAWPDIGFDPILNSKDAAGLSWADAPKF